MSSGVGDRQIYIFLGLCEYFDSSKRPITLTWNCDWSSCQKYWLVSVMCILQSSAVSVLQRLIPQLRLTHNLLRSLNTNLIYLSSNTNTHTQYTISTGVRWWAGGLGGFKIECVLISDTKRKTGKTNVTFSFETRRPTTNDIESYPVGVIQEKGKKGRKKKLHLHQKD